ncbi:MAG: hypothetical protein CMO80_25085 [Verrucomicrobiales bacterium]|nr:hypothetical protein [Verrucomicrobiales bacterium]|tara:strand:- start:1485 stop:2300 length:816 start_codon:yes stop_codon:yes gene_type:complete
MISFAKRRFYASATLVVCIALAVLADYGLRQSLRPAAICSGVLLFAVILLLACFNMRKRLTFLPTLSASTWMQIHVYVGWFSIAAFLIHAGVHQTQGTLELALAILFWLVALSGVWGLYMTRAFPAQLRMEGENVIFERIPSMRARLRRQSEEVIMESIEKTESTALADIYEKRIRDFFDGPRDILSHALGSRKAPHTFLAEIEDTYRYLSEDERAFMATLTDHVRIKQNLDYQWVRQGMLKLWLFIHIPLTYGLILTAAAHGLIAWRFAG